MRFMLASAALLAVLLPLPARSAAYWIEHGFDQRIACAGARDDGQEFKIGNLQSSEGYLIINGIVLCRDEGSTYKLHVEFLNVGNDPRSPYQGGGKLQFTWLGLSIYRAKTAGEDTIDWLFDQALPIDGTLPYGSEQVLPFGNLDFTVPKDVADEGKYFTFYITFGTQMIPFGASP
jgi:hypothetical protein